MLIKEYNEFKLKILTVTPKTRDPCGAVNIKGFFLYS